MAEPGLRIRQASDDSYFEDGLLFWIFYSGVLKNLRVFGSLREDQDWIQEYHKALKSGAKVEESQLERGYRLEPLIAVLTIVAVRLFSAKLLARSRPDSFEAAESLGPEIIQLVEHKFGKPKEGWTNQKLLVCVARVGGFIGRKRDDMPGWQTIWRGWRRLMWMCEGLEILNGTSPRCG